MGVSIFSLNLSIHRRRIILTHIFTWYSQYGGYVITCSSTHRLPVFPSQQWKKPLCAQIPYLHVWYTCIKCCWFVWCIYLRCCGFVWFSCIGKSANIPMDGMGIFGMWYASRRRKSKTCLNFFKVCTWKKNTGTGNVGPFDSPKEFLGGPKMEGGFPYERTLMAGYLGVGVFP